MVPNEDYWNDDRVPTARIEFNNVIPKAQAIKDLNAGKDIDLVTSLTPAEAESVDASDNAKVVTDEHAGLAVMGVINQQGKEAWHNADARRALNHAIQRQKLIDDAYGGYGTPTAALLRKGAFGADDDLAPYDYAPDDAKNGLSDAGIDSVNIVTSEALKPVADGIAEQLGAVGVDASVTTGEPEEGGDWDIWLVKHFDWYPRYAVGVLTREFFGESGAFRRMDTDADVMDLINQWRSTPKADEQAELSAKIEKILHDKALGLFLFAPYSLYGVANDVDYTPFDTTVLELADTTIDN